MAQTTLSGPLLVGRGIIERLTQSQPVPAGVALEVIDGTIRSGSGIRLVTGDVVAAAGAIHANAGYAHIDSLGVIDSLIRYTDTLIATAAVLTLNATPVTVVAAGGAGIYNIFRGAYVFLDNTGTAYVDEAGEDLVFQEATGNVAVSAASDGDVWDGTTDVLVWVPPQGNDAFLGNTATVNSAIEVTILSGEWATGTSPLKIRTFYDTIAATSLEGIS